MPTPEDGEPDPLFEQASRHVLDHLRDHAPMSFWAVTRVENDRQTYLTVDDAAYGKHPGGSHPWDASFCIHMTAGTAPRIAPDAQAVPQYAAAGVNADLQIGGYAGAEIRDADGTLFGAICGLDPAVKGPEMTALEPLLLLLSRMLTIALVADRQRQASDLRLLEAQLAADIDALTGVYTRRAWDRFLTEEARAFSQLADPTAVVIVDLDRLKETNDEHGHAAGDALIRRAAQTIAKVVRSQDPVARLGGDEFGVLLRGCTASAAADRAQRIRRALAAAEVEASVGVAPAEPGAGLREAQHTADRAMYEDKALRAGR